MTEAVSNRLSPFEEEAVSLFMAGAAAFSLPKSVGAIFGLIFASVEPLSLDDLVERLGISKGSGSQGLRFLQRVGAVKPVYAAASRRTTYRPETSLRRLVIGLLNENVIPHLESGRGQVARMRHELKEMDGSLNKVTRKELEQRLHLLETWNKKSRLLLPLVEKFLAGPLR